MVSYDERWQIMDKELIAMCDTPEIQDRWEPKVGDRVYIKSRHVHGHIVEIKCDNVIHVMSDDGVCYLRNTQGELIYIPSIDDVLERLAEHDITLKTVKWDWVCLFIVDYSGIKSSLQVIDKSMIRVLVRVDMHLSHNKTWNREAWV
jgi:hypothetical protein